jgi:hypothetical protein
MVGTCDADRVRLPLAAVPVVQYAAAIGARVIATAQTGGQAHVRGRAFDADVGARETARTPHRPIGYSSGEVFGGSRFVGPVRCGQPEHEFAPGSGCGDDGGVAAVRFDDLSHVRTALGRAVAGADPLPQTASSHLRRLQTLSRTLVAVRSSIA